jgi:ACS family hexuronate transporter-like MFS transporter
MSTSNANNTTSPMSKYRWTIAALLLFSTTVNYMDRNVIGFLKDYFCDPNGFGWSSTEYSYLTSMFTLFYAGFTLIVGFIIDKIGTKIGLAASLVTWSIAGLLSAVVGKGLGGQLIARALFGAGEAGNFPASIKTVAEWFPKKERALATGVFNSGSNLGAMICALIIPPMLIAWPNGGEFMGCLHGWQMAFIITSLVGFIWLIFWHRLYASPMQMLKKGKINKAEYDYINSDDVKTEVKEEVKTEAPAQKIPWYKMLTYRQTWSFVAGKFMTDGIWWFLLFWLPTYIKQQFCAGMSKDESGLTVMISTFVVFGIAIIGSVYGGSLPMSFMNKGWEAYKARMTSLLIIAFFPLLLIFTQTVAGFNGTTGLIAAVAVISIAGAAHQAFSANLFTTVSDMFPKSAVGSVTGIGAFAGGIGGVLVQLLAGGLEDHFKALGNVSTAYAVMFGVCAFAYLVAWVIMKVLVPKYKPIEMA